MLSPGQSLTTMMCPRMPQLQFEPTRILLQMKLMKAICKVKNMMKKEFEHDEEL
jgi:hypothetical protein